MTTARSILYSFRRCPYAMRARMALLISGTSCELREVVLKNKPAAMLEASPKATVPVLVLPDGEVIDQSLDIMVWALGRHDPERWLDGYDADLISANDGPFKHHLDRYKYPRRHGSNSTEHRKAGLVMLEALEKRLSVAANLCGPDRSLTDIALFPFIRQFAETDRVWFDVQAIPGVKRWLAFHLDSPLFKLAMVKYAPWKPDDLPIVFSPIAPA